MCVRIECINEYIVNKVKRFAKVQCVCNEIAVDPKVDPKLTTFPLKVPPASLL